MVNSYEDLNGLQIDAIREVASIGAGNAATALSGVLDQKVKITVPNVSVLGFDAAANVLGGPENIVSGVMVRMSGEMNGIMLYVQELDFINVVLQSVLHKDISDYSELTEMEVSALVEIGNIIISSYMTALTRLLGVQVNLSVPGHCINMAGGILTVPMAEFGYCSDKILIMDGNFICGGQETSSKMLLVPDVASLNFLLEKLGVYSG